ncbi:tetratricopeptide repeat protein [Campylobacter sp. 19-13652]|uniref:tetratricopeptide repeat protein n=1 Tax=Campylobacter sp. 19-13652 TaxID=2840180 RepID=UPI001C794779|nr:tetratricopeptide repeat protein [Campylobacter sp. 19-13652]BCX78690.1 hypothetical protein LBC_01520 [Campylobacter sp. 19-13652]
MKKLFLLAILAVCSLASGANDGVNFMANLSKACDNGDANMCSLAAELYQNDQSIADEKKFFKFSKKACDLAPNDVYAVNCHNAGMGYYEGHPFKKNKKEAARYFKLACENKKEPHFQSCAVLGMLYEKGEGVKKDVAKAKKLYAKACDNGYGAGCASIGLIFHNMGNITKAREYYEKACELGFSAVCGF